MMITMLMMIRICYPKYEVACYDAFVQGSCPLAGLRGLIVIFSLMIDQNDFGDGSNDGNDDDADGGDEGFWEFVVDEEDKAQKL